MSLGDVGPLDKDRGDAARFIANRLVSEIEKTRFWTRTRHSLQCDLHIFPYERLAGREHPIEQLNKALPRRFRDGNSNWLPQDLAMAYELLVGRIHEHKPVFWSLKEAREARRLGEHFSKTAQFRAVGCWCRPLVLHLTTASAKTV